MTPDQAAQFFPFAGPRLAKRITQLRLVCKPAPPDTRARGGFPGRINHASSPGVTPWYNTSSATPFNNYGYTVGTPSGSVFDTTQANPIGEMYAPYAGDRFNQGDIMGVTARLVPPLVRPEYSRFVQAIAPQVISSINSFLVAPSAFYGGTLYNSYFCVGEMRRAVDDSIPTGMMQCSGQAGNIIVAQLPLTDLAKDLGYNVLGVTPGVPGATRAYAPAWLIVLRDDPFGAVHYEFPIGGVPIRMTGINGQPYESVFVGGSQFRPGDPFSGSPDIFIPTRGTSYLWGSVATQNGGLSGSIFIGQGTSDSLYGGSAYLSGTYAGTGGGGDMYEILTRDYSANAGIGLARSLLTVDNQGWNPWAGNYAPIDQSVFYQVLLGGGRLQTDVDPYGIFADNPGNIQYVGTTAYGYLVVNDAANTAGAVYLIYPGGTGYIEFTFEDEAGNQLFPKPSSGDASNNVCTAIAPDGTVYLNTATQGPYLSYDFRIKFPHRQLPRIPPRTLNNVLTKHSIIGKY